MSKIRKFFFGLLLSLLLVLFLTNSFFTGAFALANPLLYLFLSFIVIFLFVLYGAGSAVPVFLAALLSVYVSHYDNGAVYPVSFIQLIIFVLIPWLFSYLMSRGISIQRSLFYPPVLIFIFLSAGIFLYLFSSRADIVPQINSYASALAAQTQALYGKIGLKSLASPGMNVEIKSLFADMLLLLPGIALSLSWIGLWVGFLMVKAVFKNIETAPSYIKNYISGALFRVSDYFIVLLLAGIITVLLSPEVYKFIGYNIIFAVSSVYMVQGLSIISYFFIKNNLNFFLRVLIYILIFLFSNPLLVIVIIAGIFDTWFNFRERASKIKKE